MKTLCTLLAVLSIVCGSLQQDNTTYYEHYSAEMRLLEQKDTDCTDFVFPGKSLCNYLLLETILVDLPPPPKGIEDFTFTTELVAWDTHAIDYEFLTATNINSFNHSNTQSCSIKAEVHGGMKQASITCKYLYENPQYFEITSKLSSAVKAPTDDSNAASWTFFQAPLLKKLKLNTYGASVWIPYKDFTAEDYSTVPKPDLVVVANGTTLGFTNVTMDSPLEVSIKFTRRYPHCDKIMWYTWTMWALVAAIVVIAILFVIGYGIYKLVKRRKDKDGYVVQADHRDHEVNMY